jgi:hypothetical protein
MPLCKYKNYCLFLEKHFEVKTTKDDFYENKKIVYVCHKNSHVNTLSIASFGNKKSKIDIEHFCQGCKNDEDCEKQKVEFCQNVLETTGHIILEVNFSTRKLEYQCGNCGSINKSFIQNFDKNTTSFCNKCQNNKRINNKEYKDSILKKYEETCLKRYGVRNVSQNSTIFERIVKRSYLRKNYKMPSGKMVIIQGYEGYAIDELLQENIKEDDIIIGKEIPRFSYTEDDIQHTYHPDLFVKSKHLIIEVKSDYTYLMNVRRNYLKFRKVIESGYHLRVLIYDNKLKIKDVTFKTLFDLNVNLLDAEQTFNEFSNIKI